MSLDKVLRKYIDELHELPASLRDRLEEIRRLDLSVETTKRQLHVKTRNQRRPVPVSAQLNVLQNLDKEYEALERLTEKKFRLANETYELLDQYIIKLDDETREFQNAMRKRFSDAFAKLEPGTSAEETPVIPRKMRKSRMSEKEAGSADAPGFTSVADATAMTNDLPLDIDPNEPRYCFCQQVSYGEMIGCDNKDCPIEWFHFQCVNLTEKPRGEWYCPECQPLIKKKTHSSGRKTSV